MRGIARQRTQCGRRRAPPCAECRVSRAALCDSARLVQRQRQFPQLLGALAPKPGAADFALALTTWSSSVTLFTDGRIALSGDERAQLAKADIRVYDERITSLETHGERLLVQLASETVVPIHALFAHSGFQQHAEFTKELGYELEPSGRVRTDDHQRTNVPGLYVAGDAEANLRSVNVAAASGYVAATAINRQLREEAHR